MRLRTDIWVSALIRRVEAAGAFALVARKGAAESGSVLVVVNRPDKLQDLYGPAAQSRFDETRPADRLFDKIVEGQSAEALQKRIEQEIRFDSDLWIVEVDDRQGRPFVDFGE